MPVKTTTEEIKVLNVRLPNDVIGWIDEIVTQGTYGSRSEMIRSLIRDYVRENR